LIALTVNRLTSLVHVANHIALAAGVGVDSSGMAEPLKKQALEILRITEADLEALYGGLPELLGEMNDLRTV
jgi:hypothetical protein